MFKGVRLFVAMGKSWLEMHLKWIHTSSLKPQKHGQSWSTALRSRGFTRSQEYELLVLIIIVEICEVGVGVGLPSEMRGEVFVSLL